MRNNELSKWLDENLKELRAGDDTRSYVIGVFCEFLNSGDHDMSRESMVLSYAHAVHVGEFCHFKRCGDWSLWASVYAPDSIETPAVVIELGMRCYDACDRIMLRKWPVFNELAARLPEITENTRRLLFR